MNLLTQIISGLLIFGHLCFGAESPLITNETFHARQMFRLEAGPGLILETNTIDGVTVLRFRLASLNVFTNWIGTNIFTTNIVMADVLPDVVRNVALNGTNYQVCYSVNTNGSYSVPLTNPPGPPHWKAKVWIFQGTHKLSGPLDGTYVAAQCIVDDWPANYVRRALGLEPQYP